MAAVGVEHDVVTFVRQQLKIRSDSERLLAEQNALLSDRVRALEEQIALLQRENDELKYRLEVIPTTVRVALRA